MLDGDLAKLDFEAEKLLADLERFCTTGNQSVSIATSGPWTWKVVDERQRALRNLFADMEDRVAVCHSGISHS
jgi:hypothetical protein